MGLHLAARSSRKCIAITVVVAGTIESKQRQLLRRWLPQIANSKPKQTQWSMNELFLGEQKAGETIYFTSLGNWFLNGDLAGQHSGRANWGHPRTSHWPVQHERERERGFHCALLPSRAQRR